MRLSYACSKHSEVAHQIAQNKSTVKKFWEIFFSLKKPFEKIVMIKIDNYKKSYDTTLLVSDKDLDNHKLKFLYSMSMERRIKRFLLIPHLPTTILNMGVKLFLKEL